MQKTTTLLSESKQNNFAEQCREELIDKMTEAEKVYKNKLDKMKVKYEFQKIIWHDEGSFYIVDFYLPFCNTIIEIDGGYHQTPEQMNKDRHRSFILRSMGYNISRLTNEWVIKKYGPKPKKEKKQILDITEVLSNMEEYNFDQKKLATIALKLRQSGFKGKIVPHLDNNNPQMEVCSYIYPDIMYNIRMEAHMPRVYVYSYQDGVWKVVLGGLPGYEELSSEYKKIVSCLND